MEEKDLQAGNSAPEMPIVETEVKQAQEPAPAFEMNTAEAPVTEVPAPQPPVIESVKEKKTGKVSSFMRRGGLFEGYEISSAKEMPFFIRIFAASALFHLVVIASALQLPAVVQTTCESTEFTQKLCDTMYVASLLSNSAGRDFVDEPYDPTQIPDAADVTFITADSFQYPEGYWTLRDELEGRVSDPMMMDPTLSDVNGINTGSPTTLDLGAPATLPNPNSGAVSGGAIDSPFSVGGAPPVNPPVSGTRSSGKRGKKPPLAGGSPGALPELDDAADDTAANAKLGKKNGKTPNPGSTPAKIEPKKPLAEEAYNKKPLYEFRDKLVEWREAGQNNFYQQFQYSLAGTIDKEGKLAVEGTPTFNGDPKMREIIKTAVGSFSDSGMFKLLKDLQSKAVKITFMQDGNQFNVRLETMQETDRKAFGLASTLNLIIEGGKILNSGADDKDTFDLLNMAKVRSEGNLVVIDTVVPNQFAEALYQKYKKDLEEKKSKQTGVAGNANGNKNAY